VLNRRFFLFPLFLVLLLVGYGNFFMIARVQESSMEPSLHNGQIVLIKKITQETQRGDILVFRLPHTREWLVKRCVLSQGDTILINDHQLLGYHRKYFLTYPQEQWLKEYDKVPLGNFLVLGDNQFHSRDSRDLGFIKNGWVIGRVIKAYE
jgi:signal peptidase I